MLLLLFVELNGKSQESKRICPRAWRFRSSLLVPETTITRRAANLARKGGQRGFAVKRRGTEGASSRKQGRLLPASGPTLFFFLRSPTKKKTKFNLFPPQKPTHHGASDAGGAGHHRRAAAGDGGGAHGGDAGGESEGHSVYSGRRKRGREG